MVKIAQKLNFVRTFERILGDFGIILDRERDIALEFRQMFLCLSIIGFFTHTHIIMLQANLRHIKQMLNRFMQIMGDRTNWSLTKALDFW